MRKFYLVSFVVILIDRISKILVQFFLTNREITIIKNYLYLVYAKNDGAAFSILGGKQIFFILFGLLALCIIYTAVKKNNINNIGYSFLFGGIIGNLIDRILYSYVIDFICVEKFSVFNIADSFIVIGAIFILLGSDKNEVKNR